MKRIVTFALVALMTMAMVFAQGAAEAQSAEKTELTVFAAASMTETMTEIAKLYQKDNPAIEIVYNFDSSGTLKTQIEEGAVCDVFISAAQKQMNQLDASQNGLDYVLQGSRINLLENKVTLAVPTGNPKGIHSFEQLAELLREGDVFLAIGNSDVPVGQYTQKIFTYYGLDEKKLADEGLLTYGSNVKEVTTHVAEAAVDAGIIYGTDAYSAGLTVVDSATGEMTGGQVIYPAAVMKTSAHQSEAQAFLDYLTGDESMAVFESVGFAPAAR